MDNNSKKCATIREFFDYLIDSGQLLESQKIYDEKSRTKFINGRVTVDGTHTVSGLDWSRIKARQFRFINDSASAEPLVSAYEKLPVTSYGISGDLPKPENIIEFLEHNAFGHFHIKKDKIIVEKNITLVDMVQMDFSNVEVQGDVIWHAGKIKLSHLPKVSGKILGLSRDKIIPEKDQKLNEEALKARHVQPSVFLDQKSRGFIRELFGRFGA